MSRLTDDEVRALITKAYGHRLDACRELLEFAINEVQNWSGRPVKRGADRIIIFEAARATKTLDAVIRLCELGYGEQAVMLNRSLFEGMVVAHWVSANRREAAWLFRRHAKFGSTLWRERFDARGWLSHEDRGQWRAVSPKEREEFVELFGKYGERPWTRRSLPKLLQEVENQWDEQGREQLWAMHDIANRHSNLVLHSSPFSAGATATAETGGELHMTIGASNQFIDQALYFAYWSYGQFVGLLIEVFRLSSNDAFLAIWEPAGGAFAPEGQ
jgi:hypothetical protein